MVDPLGATDNISTPLPAQTRPGMLPTVARADLRTARCVGSKMCFGAWLVSASISSPSHAQKAASPPPIAHVTLESNDCIRQGRLANEVKKRGGQLDESADLRFYVTAFAPRTGPILLRIEGRDSLGEFATRVFSTSSCAEAETTLAVVVALATRQRPPSKPPPEELSTPPVAEPARRAPPPTASPTANAKPVAPRAAPIHPLRFVPYAALGLGASSAFNGELFGFLGGGLARASTWLPWFEASMAGAWPRTVSGTLGDARFLDFELRLRVAPVVVRWRALALSPFAAATGGLLLAQGARAPVVEEHVRPTFSLQPGARLALGTGRVVGRLDGGVNVPLRRDRFIFRTGEEVYQMPALVVFAELSLAVQFP